jgi:hypothetical protein
VPADDPSALPVTWLVWLLPPTGGEARRITDLPGGVDHWIYYAPRQLADASR